MYSATEQMVAWLSAKGHRASTYPPKNPPEEFVTVELVGGHVADMVDHPSIAVQTWAPTEARAEEIALGIRLDLLTGELPTGYHSVRVNAGPYPFYDQDTRCPRFQMVLDVTSQLTE